MIAPIHKLFSFAVDQKPFQESWFTPAEAQALGAVVSRINSQKGDWKMGADENSPLIDKISITSGKTNFKIDLYRMTEEQTLYVIHIAQTTLSTRKFLSLLERVEAQLKLFNDFELMIGDGPGNNK